MLWNSPTGRSWHNKGLADEIEAQREKPKQKFPLNNPQKEKEIKKEKEKEKKKGYWKSY